MDGQATQAELERAQTLIEEAVEMVGEENFGALVETIAGGKLRTAVARLQSSQWWEETLKESLTNPVAYNTALLSKLLDKAIPSQQAVKVGAEDGFRLVIETTTVERKEE